MQDKQFISTTEAAKILGVSRIAVFDRIKKGKIPAKKVGRNFIIEKNQIVKGNNTKIADKEKEVINKAVERTLKDYGETLKQLANA
ncbi:MAG: excisionase family DNA-binding protein [bacterium]